jgi:hypothetical protein
VARRVRAIVLWDGSSLPQLPTAGGYQTRPDSNIGNNGNRNISDSSSNNISSSSGNSRQVATRRVLVGLLALPMVARVPLNHNRLRIQCWRVVSSLAPLVRRAQSFDS